jgi:hypothetical protein
MSWLITLEVLSAQGDNLYWVISLQEKKSAINNNNILNKYVPRRRSRPNKSSRTTINTGRQFSFDTSQNCRAATGAHCSSQFGAHVWRRVVGAAAVATSF